MKLVVAIVKPFKLDDVKEKLKSLGVNGMTTFKNLPAIRFMADGTIDENSPQTLRLADARGNALWLVEARNHMGYDIRDTEK